MNERDYTIHTYNPERRERCRECGQRAHPRMQARPAPVRSEPPWLLIAVASCLAFWGVVGVAVWTVIS